MLPITTSTQLLRMAACQDRELFVNDHFGELLIFCSKIPLDKLFSKIMFLSFSDSYIFINLRKSENAVFRLPELRLRMTHSQKLTAKTKPRLRIKMESINTKLHTILGQLYSFNSSE